jgi:uncharacterized protein (TIGR02246 family)
MKQIYISLLLFPLLFLQQCTQENSTPSQTEELDREAITAMSSARAEAFNQSDAAAIAVHFTEDAVLMAPGVEAMTGREAVRDYYQSIFDQYEPELESRYVEIKVEGDLAYGRGIATVTLTPIGGSETTVSTSKYLNILQRQPDGTWKTTHDIWNGNSNAD